MVAVSAFADAAGAVLAKPKSSTLICPRGVRMMFAGLMSRCVIRLACAASGAQSFALDILHGDEVHPAGFADLVDGRDIGVAERGGGLSFLDKPAQAVA